MPKITKRFVDSITPDTEKTLKYWDSEPMFLNFSCLRVQEKEKLWVRHGINLILKRAFGQNLPI